MNRSTLLIRGLAAGAALTALGLIAPIPASGAPAPVDRNSTSASAEGSDQVLHALQRDLGLTREQAEQQLAARRLDTQLRAQLGADFAGDWYDQRTGKLIVAVSSAKRAAEVKAAGAEVKLVSHSRAKLDAIKAELDTLASADKAGISAWHIDPKTNAVVVTVLAGQPTAKALAKLARHGNAVRIEQTDAAPSTVGDFLDGGDPIGGCSVGFNAFAGSTRYVLFAGHCGTVGTQVHGTGGHLIGTIVASSFPGNDYALVRVDNTAYWTQGPWVDAYDGAGGFFDIHGWFWTQPPAGVAICKSGKTTGLTCGAVTVQSESVNVRLNDGTLVTVHELTRHNACVERGDSGGSNFSWDANGNWAEGLTSAALLLDDGRCRSKGGLDNRSWFQYVGEPISVYGVSLYTA